MSEDMRIEFDRPTKELSRSSRRRLTDKGNNLSTSGFFRTLFGGLVCGDLGRSSFGCNEANERLTHLRLSLPPSLPPASLFVPSLLSHTTPTTL